MKKLLMIMLIVPALVCSMSGSTVKVSKKEVKIKKVLARVTYYDAETCPYGFKSATGVRLKKGHVAVDPKKIPYGTKIYIPEIQKKLGVKEFKAVDTGTDVKNRKAARVSGKTKEQKNAIVIDVFVPTARECNRYALNTPMFIMVEICN